MSRLTNLTPTTTLGTEDQAIIRQGNIDKRIPLSLAETLSWAKREGYTHLGEHAAGIGFLNPKSFTTYEGRVYFVKEEVTLPYSSGSSDASVDTNLYVGNTSNLSKPSAWWATFKLKAAGAVSRSLYDKVIERGASPEDYGAVGDGITDDTAACKLAMQHKKVIFTGGKTYLISDSLTPISGQHISAYGAIVTTGSNAISLFYHTGSVTNFHMEGGQYMTDPNVGSAFFNSEGPPNYGNGLGFFSFTNIQITNMLYGFKLSNARTGTISGVRCAAKYAVDYTNKSAEVIIKDSWLISTSQQTSTGGYGIRCFSGSDGYPEGLNLVNTLVYRFEKNLRIEDIYEFKSVGNYYDGSGNIDGNQFDISKNNFLVGLNFQGDWISSGHVQFLDATAPVISRTIFSACEFNNQQNGTAIHIGKFHFDISVKDCRFDGRATGTNVGVVCVSNNSNIHIDGCTFDRFVSYAQFKGSGSGNSVRNIPYSQYVGSDPVSYEYPVTISEVAGTTSLLIQDNIVAGTYSAGTDINTAGRMLGCGTYLLLTAAQVTAATGANVVTSITPTGDGIVDIPDGSGWSATYNVQPDGDNRITESLPFTVLKEGVFTVTLSVASGDITLAGSHNAFTLVRV